MTGTTVLATKKETHDTVTIKLGLDGEEFKFKAGQAINIDPYQFESLKEKLEALKQIKGQEETPRDFSISSSPLEKDFIEITVKEEKAEDHEPVLSPFLVRHLKTDDKVEINGPFGIYTPPPNLDGLTTFVHVCAGSGIAPNRGIIKFMNEVRLDIRHILFYQVRSEADIIYRNEIPTWKNFKFCPVLSRPSPEWHGERGYLTKEHLSREIISAQSTMAFVCGPSRPRPNHEDGFIKKYKDMLVELGVPPKNVKTEMW